MAGKIFVNYRRDDDPSAAARVRDGLAAKFGKADVFMDVSDLLAGLKFDQELAKALAGCDVFIAIIGARWMPLLNAKVGRVERDYVREEIGEALKRNIVVIPVRVGRDGQLPSLPTPDDLPEDIRELVSYQKQDVTHERFDRDVAGLIDDITAVRQRLQPQKSPLAPHVPWGWIGATAISVLSIGYVGAYFTGVPLPWPWVSPTERRTNETGVEPRRVETAKAEAEALRKADPTPLAKSAAEAEAKRKADEAERQRLAALQEEQDRRQAVENIRQKTEAEARAKSAADTQRQADLAKRNGAPSVASTKAEGSNAETPKSERRFDGSWTITYTRVGGCPVAAPGTGGSYVLRFQGGIVTGVQLSGKVSSSGALRWSGEGSISGRVTYTGVVNGNMGTGRYRNTNGCYGTFTARRS